MAEHVIQITNLSKDYKTKEGPFRALNRLNLMVKEGEIFGYLGPNGSGKTTTIRMMFDFIRPTEGKINILGLDAQSDSVALHHKVGFIPGELNLWRNEKAGDIIRFVGNVRGSLDMNYVNQLAERLQFDMSKKMRDYSTGNKRKIGLILAMMNKPEVLILDEPTTGLDPLMQHIFNQMMEEVRDEGRTVFLSSHVLSEVQAICDRVGVLRNGDLKAVETVDTLMEAEFRWVVLRYREVPQNIDKLAAVAGVSDVSIEGNDVTLRMFGDFDPMLKVASEQYVVDLETKEPTLEEIFLEYYDEGDGGTANGNNKRKNEEVA
jgi:ABC-2 type transport system ATP-binding protein